MKIEQLGRIRNSEILISPLMVFSGESGLGKSYLALLCHYFFELQVNSYRLNHFFLDKNIDFNVLSRDFHDKGTALQINKSDLEEWMEKDAIHYLRYMLGHDKLNGSIKITLPDTFPKIMSFEYKKELTGIVDSEDISTILSLEDLSLRIQENTTFDESPFSLLLRFVMRYNIFRDHLKVNSTFVLPPSRGPVLTEQFTPTTGMYSEFLRDMTELNRIKPIQNTVSDTVTRLFEYIMEGEVRMVEGKYIYTSGEASMPVSAAAASIREIAPLQILAKNQDVSKCAILVEEPEAHLHPLKQRMMADIIASLSHNGAIMQITTHSDYFLRRLNEILIFVKAKERNDDKERIERIAKRLRIVDGLQIDASSLGAYLLKRQEDGSSMAIRQDSAEGVPFTAFRDAIIDNINNQDLLNEIM